MATFHHQENSDSRRRLLPILGAIVIGYVVVFIEALSKDVFPYSFVQLVAIVVLGVVYTFLLIKEEVFFTI
jgi:hypothetical protein